MKKFAKLAALLMAAAMLLALCACGNESEADNPYKTITPGVLTVATSPDYAPYEFYAIGADGTAELAGFDIALVKYIADYLKLELEIIPMDFDGVLLELANGSVDLGVAGISPDPDRAESMDFSDIYYAGLSEHGEPMFFLSLYDYWHEGTTNELYLYVQGIPTGEFGWDENWNRVELTTPDSLYDLGDTQFGNIIATITSAEVIDGLPAPVIPEPDEGYGVLGTGIYKAER